MFIPTDDIERGIECDGLQRNIDRIKIDAFIGMRLWSSFYGFERFDGTFELFFFGGSSVCVIRPEPQ